MPLKAGGRGGACGAAVDPGRAGARAQAGRDPDRAPAGRGRGAYDVELRGGRLRCHPSAFAKLALAERGLLRQVQGLNGKAIHYFALNLREWRALRRAADDGCLKLEPSLPGAVERVVAEAAREATPMYPVKPQMRLGFVADLERLHCVKDDPDRGFLCGEDVGVAMNPVALVDRPRGSQGGSRRLQFLQAEELDAVMRATPDDKLGAVERPLCLCAAMTGMRQGELLALRWADVDRTAHRVRVVDNFTRGRFGTPKVPPWALDPDGRPSGHRA